MNIIGRRVAIPEATSREQLGKLLEDLKPGDYCGPIRGYFGGDDVTVWFRLPVPLDHPDAGLRHVREPTWRFSELSDGSIEISPSILARRGAADGAEGWHGFLRAKHQWEVLDPGSDS